VALLGGPAGELSRSAAWEEETVRRRSPQQLVIVAIVFIVVILGYNVRTWWHWRERADSATGVSVKLSPARQVIPSGRPPHLVVTVVNAGSQEVVLVEPGDGSECGWRTPIIEWSIKSWRPYGRCGNINPLRADEVFVLQPGESRQLSAWVGVPPLPGPGRYRVAVRYVNQPDHAWLGVPLGEHDEVALREVQQSSSVVAVSNSVEIVVEE
jgi:hypothetical protein